MDAQGFLSAVLPDTGIICITTIAKTPQQHFFESVEDALNAVEGFKKRPPLNIYYAMATFLTDDNRKKENVQCIKSFWLDLDCGSKTPYATPNDGLNALNEFSSAANLPTPMAVCSGYGVHAYWVLSTPITVDEWQPVASKLPTLCHKYNLSLKDSAPTVDSVRILRVPDTLNFKDPANPTPVYVMQDGDVISFNQFKSLFIEAYGEQGAAEFEPTQKITSLMSFNSNVDTLTTSIASSFRQIVVNRRCNQVNMAIEERATLDEPRWRAMLSIANVCVDRDKAIKVVSIDHPDYDFVEANKKAIATKGPYTCETFKNQFPAGCLGCTEKVTSPIVLGRIIEEAKSNEIVTKTNIFANDEDEPIEQELRYEVTPYPFPYKRGVKGGIYIDVAVGTDGTTKPECVYENDIYAVRRYHDDIEGESVLGRLHLPHDGMREFILPLKTVLTAEKLRDALAMQGVAAPKKNMDRIMGMFTLQIRNLQRESRARSARRQFGWHDDYACFVVGDREIRKSEIVYSPPSSTTTNMIHDFVPRGKSDTWLSIVNTLNIKGFELQAFTFLAGLGSPLFKFTGQKGAVINLVSEGSGTGKTTTLLLINSIWGHPEHLLLLPADTVNARVFRVGIYCNIGICMDEITNMTPEAMSDLLYAMSNGRGKHRLESGSNQERTNNTSWNTIGVTTSNATVRDKLAMAKSKSEGENMRLIEFYLSKAGNYSKEEADAIYDPLKDNFGHAGPVFMQYILNNREKVLTIIDEERLRFDKEFGAVSKERMWSAVFASAFAAGRIAKLCGLFDWNLDSIRNTMMQLMEEQRQNVVDAVENPNDTLGNFLSENIGGVVIVKGTGPNLNVMPLENATEKARVRLVARYEEDTKTLYIAQNAIRDYCTKRQISFTLLVKNLRKEPWFVGIENKRIGTGTGLTLPPIRVLHLEGEFDFFGS